MQQTFEVELPDGTIIEGPTKDAALLAARKRLNPQVAKATTTALTQEQLVPKDSTIRARTWNDTFNDIIEKHHTAISGGIGTAAGLMTGVTGVGAPASGLVGSGVMALVDNYLTGLHQKQGTPIQEATKVGVGTLENEAANLLTGGVLRGAKGLVKEIKVPGSISGKISELKPTYSEYPGSLPGAGFVEDLFATKRKSAAGQESAKIIEEKAKGVVRSLSGLKVNLNDTENLASTIAHANDTAFDRISSAANISAEAARAVAKANPEIIPPAIPGGTPKVLSGKINPTNLVNEAVKLRNELKSPLGEPDPNNPLLRDVDAIIRKANVQFDKSENVVSYDPTDFETAWASKIDFGDKGFSNPRKSQEIADVRFQRLFKAIDQDMEQSIPQWKIGGKQGLQNYLEAKKITNDKYQLYFPEGGGSELNKMILPRGRTTFPSSPVPEVSKVISDPKKLQRMLDAGEYKLGNIKIANTNIRKEAAGYAFMDAYLNAQELANPKQPNYRTLNANKLQTSITELLNSDSGKKLYSRQTADNIKELTTQFAHVDQSLNPQGSRYLYLRLGSGVANIGAALLAGRVGPSTYGGIGLIGGAISLNALGKLMTHPPTARLMIALTKGAPLGMSGEAASRLLANGLRGQAVTLLYGDGKEVRGTYDANDQFVADK